MGFQPKDVHYLELDIEEPEHLKHLRLDFLPLRPANNEISGKEAKAVWNTTAENTLEGAKISPNS